MKIETIEDVFDNFEYDDILNQIPEERIVDYLLDEIGAINLLGYFDLTDLVEYLNLHNVK